MKYTKQQEAEAKRLWLEYCAKHKLPAGVPVNPDKVYADKGWRGWCDWIGGAPATFSNLHALNRVRQ